ncbi:MAG: hypothetical protein MUC62_04970 [Candidatus Thermoplasmatota archaeon]|nr:hypothetical protein [Candidatus Thermoplasmatota archaeon]
MTSMKVLGKGPLRPALVLTIVLVLSTLLLALDPVLDNGTTGEADALRPVSLAISLYPRGDEGNVVDVLTGPGTTGMQSVRGKVDLFRSARALRTRVLANLNFESSRPDIVRGSVFPRIMDFDPISKFNHTDIMINIFVTPMINYSSVVGGLIKVRVWGDWFTPFSQGVQSWSTGTIEEFYIYVNIKPFHYLDLMFDPPMVQIRPGEPTELDVIVRNRGNGNERVELSIPNEVTYAKSGWSFEFESTVLDIPPRADGRVSLRIVPPRRQQFKYHMEVLDFNVRAVSHNSRFQVIDGDRTEENWFEMSFSVYTLGLDTVFVPFTWTIVLYLLFLLIMFNIGINMFTLRKRKLPKGKYPGLIALYRLISSPARREERARARQISSELRREVAEKKRLVREAEASAKPERTVPRARPLFPISAPEKKVKDDGFDIDLPPVRARSGQAAGPQNGRSKPLRPRGKGGADGFENEVLDVLGSLDD